MDTKTIVWIVVAVVVLVALLGIAVWARRRGTRYQEERARSRAASLRREAAAREPELKRAEAEARELQAEADRKAAEAQRLAAIADQRGKAVADHRTKHDETLSRADELDPDVPTEEGVHRRDR